MLIGLISTSYSGKGTVTEYLVKNHSFQILPDDLDEEDDISAYILKENRWTCNYVFYPNLAKCEYYMKRPFFLLVYIDASIMIRFERYLNLNSTAQDFNNDLTLFITNNDPLHVNLPLVRLMYKADIRLYNSGNCIQTFYKYLDRCDLTNKDRLRPSWDTYFIRLCDWSARRSNCIRCIQNFEG